MIINNILTLDLTLEGRCHGASCLQANGTEDVKDDRLKKEKRKEKRESN